MLFHEEGVQSAVGFQHLQLGYLKRSSIMGCEAKTIAAT